MRVWCAALVGVVLSASVAFAQPAGWSYVGGVQLQENSGTALEQFPVKITLDTAALIAAGKMRSDAGDLRFSISCAFTEILPYWIESGVNTATTTIWVRVPLLAASSVTNLYYTYGNGLVVSQSALDVFETHYTATDRVSGGVSSSVGNDQRGFRFSPNDDLLVTHLGRTTPTDSARWVTLFDNTSQAIVLQRFVAGATAAYSSVALTTPIWLKKNQQYVIAVHQGANDGYYYRTTAQMNSHVTFYETRYCNACDQNAFPTNVVATYQYGYPDFEFWVAKHAPENLDPTIVARVCGDTTTCNADCLPLVCGDGYVNTVAGETCDDQNTVDGDDCLNNCRKAICGDGVKRDGIEQCDDGNLEENDACRNDCNLAHCGDGVVYAAEEECDDGNGSDNDACPRNCKHAVCGDGFLYLTVEACDDGNHKDGDGCSSTCTVESVDMTSAAVPDLASASSSDGGTPDLAHAATMRADPNGGCAFGGSASGADVVGLGVAALLCFALRRRRV